MHTEMRRSILWHIVAQAPKITVLRVTGGVRPSREIPPMFSKICSHLHVGFLSKNAVVGTNPSRKAPDIRKDLHLPTI